MDEKLIDAIKKIPCLWNTSLAFYKCNETKDAAWEKIVKEVKYKDVKSAKNRWKQLRDSHRDALKRQNSKKSGQATAKTREWKYQKIMEFLLTYMANRERESSYKEDIPSPTNQNDSSQSIQHAESSYKEDFIASPNSFLNQDDSSQSTRHSNPDNPYEIASTSGISTDSVTPSSSKKKKDVELTNLLQKHMENQEYFRKERQELKELLKPTECDDIDHFFLSMAKTFKKLPDYIHVPLKRKLFNLISEAEESYVMSWYNQNVDYSSSSGTNTLGQVELSPQPQSEQIGYSSSSGRNTNNIADQVELSPQPQSEQIGYSSSSGRNTNNIADQVELSPQPQSEQIGYSSSSGRNTNNIADQVELSPQPQSEQIGYSSSSGTNTLLGQVELSPQPQSEQIGYSSSSGRNTNNIADQVELSPQPL